MKLIANPVRTDIQWYLQKVTDNQISPASWESINHQINPIRNLIRDNVFISVWREVAFRMGRPGVHRN